MTRIFQAVWDKNETICPTVTGYVEQYGEPYRRLIEDAAPFLVEFRAKHQLKDFDISAVIADLVERAHVTPLPQHTPTSD